MITGTCASTAGSKDSAIFQEIMNQTIENLNQNEIELDEVIADRRYKHCKYVN